MWLGELFEKTGDIMLAEMCYRRLDNKWKLVSPWGYEKAAEASMRVSEINEETY